MRRLAILLTLIFLVGIPTSYCFALPNVCFKLFEQVNTDSDYAGKLSELKKRVELVLGPIEIYSSGKDNVVSNGDAVHRVEIRRRNQVIGFIDYWIFEPKPLNNFRPETLHIHNLFVDSFYRKKQVSKLLLGAALQTFPTVKMIDGEMYGDNAKYGGAPAYRLRTYFGFTQIDYRDGRSLRMKKP